MADSSEPLVDSMGTEDFLELVNSCGLEMPRDVLDQLERRRLIVPAEVDGEDAWTLVHLYLVALYFDAVTQIRHPWTSISGGMTVNEVSAKADDVVEFVEKAVDEPGSVEAGAVQLGEEISDFLETRNPIGELAEVLDLKSARLREMLDGRGRLYAELMRLADGLAAWSSPRVNAFAEAVDETTAPIDAPESEADVDEGDDEGSDENVFADVDPTEVMNEEELSAVAEEAESENAPGASDDNEFAREESNVTSRTRDLRSRLDNLRHEDRKVARERGKSVDVDNPETGSEADDEEADEMADRIAELNRLREQYLAAQQWEKLTELYEDGISLFVEPQERQQVYMTLAMLYEVKLNEQDKALERFIDAYTEEDVSDESLSKALEGIRRVGRQKANRARLTEWLEEAVTEVEDPARRAQLQREYALALHASGEGQRAFFTYTSYLADAPRDQITSEVLDDLEVVAEGVDADELTAFYRDLLGDGLSDEVYADVAMRAARHAADEGGNELAVELYEKLLDVQPDHEVAFHSLAHLYEDTERWLELYQLYQERVEQKGDDVGPALTSELERVEGQLLDHADYITYRLEAAFVSGDEDIVDDFAGLYVKHERYAEGYAFLNKFVEDADDDGARARAFLALARIAVRHLHAPEEAALHYERALELGGPNADVLQDLARVRFDSGDWTDALMAVKALIGQLDEEFDESERIKWLGMGIRAAYKAERRQDRQELVAHLREIDPAHDLVAETSEG